ncbi:MAG: hypothetical protein ABII13_03255 [Patescibacteria group bacterium]|nr:hypothetical protein [Patescibacteria group bacterium]
MRKNDFKAAVWKEGKYYVSQCLNVDVSSFGKTKIQALENLHDAVELYFEDVKKPKYVRVEQPSVVSLKF